MPPKLCSYSFTTQFVPFGLLVVCFDQRLDVAYSKCWSKYVFHPFLVIFCVSASENKKKLQKTLKKQAFGCAQHPKAGRIMPQLPVKDV